MGIVISSGLVLGVDDSILPLDHPRIMYDDILRGAVLTPSTEAVGFEAINVNDYLTYDFWRPTALPATLEVETEEARPVDYVLIAAHTLGSAATSVLAQYHNGATWVTFGENLQVLPGSNLPVVFLFEEVMSNRFLFTFTGSEIPSIGVVMMGRALAVERKLYRGHTPIMLGRKTTIRPSRSENGQWLGRSIRREGVATEIALSNLTASWVREKLDPFIESARVYPFGWAWRPADFPAEVAYCWTLADIKPVNTGPRDLMGVTFGVEGSIE